MPSVYAHPEGLVTATVLSTIVQNMRETLRVEGPVCPSGLPYDSV